MILVDEDYLENILEKPSPYGPDIDLSKYKLGEPAIDELRVDNLPKAVDNVLERLGINPNQVSYFQIDEEARYRVMEKYLAKYGVVIKPLKKALMESDLPRKLIWSIVKPDTDKYTAATKLYGGEIGYFIYVPPNTRVPLPIYTCLAIVSDKKIQFAHNIVYVDDHSEAHLVTGCAVPHGVADGVHIDISEFYVGRGARLTYTMIHAWTEGLHVRPRTGVVVEENGEYVSYYIVYSPVGSIQTYPKIFLNRGSKAYLASIVSGSRRGVYDIGSSTILREEYSSSEIVSRTLARDESQVIARAEVEAYEKNTKGHVECLGLLLSNKAYISSIPVITSKKQGALLSHEAAIGVIAEKELEYLMSKGFTEDEAKSILIRGFMDTNVPGLPDNIRRETNRIIDLIVKHAVG